MQALLGHLGNQIPLPGLLEESDRAE